MIYFMVVKSMMKRMHFTLSIGLGTITIVKCHYQDQRVFMSDLWEHIDLCSGIGGFSLGFQYAKLSEPILFCELDDYCQKILKKHWPNVPICNDVKELANDTNAFIPRPRGRKRILTAGYPCQPFSQAGQRRGTEDPRHIWPYILRIIQQERFDVCVFENVSGHISLGLDEVLHDLEGEGYTTRTFVLPAEACGASHRRDRLWIIGRNVDDSNNDKCNEPGGAIPSEEEGNKEQKWTQDSSTGNTSGASELRISNQGHDDVANTTSKREWEKIRNLEKSTERLGEKRSKSSGRITSSSSDVAYTNDQGIRTRQRGSVSEPLQQNDAGNNHAERVGDYDGNKDGEPQVLQKDAEDVGNPKIIPCNEPKNNFEASTKRERKLRRTGSTEDVDDTNSEGLQRQREHIKLERKQSEKQFAKTSTQRNVPDTNSKQGCSGQTGGQDAEDARQSPESEEQRGRNTQRRLGRMVDGLSPWMDEPVDIPRVASGQKNRTHRLKALGNAIVPPIAQRIGIAIKETL